MDDDDIIDELEQNVAVQEPKTADKDLAPVNVQLAKNEVDSDRQLKHLYEDYARQLRLKDDVLDRQRLRIKTLKVLLKQFSQKHNEIQNKLGHMVGSDIKLMNAIELNRYAIDIKYEGGNVKDELSHLYLDLRNQIESYKTSAKDILASIKTAEGLHETINALLEDDDE